MKKYISAILVVVLIVGIAYLLSLFQSSKVKIGYLPLAMHAPLFVANENKYFENNKLEVELIEYSSSSELMKSLLANQIDVAYELGTDVALNALIENPTSFKIYQISLSTPENPSDFILVPFNSEIDSLAKLKNKKVGVFPGPTADLFFKMIINKETEIKLENEIIISSYSPLIQIKSLSTGEIDALFTYEPIASKAIVEGKAKALEVAPVEKYIINPWPGGVGLLSKYFIEKNPLAAQKTVECLYRAFIDIQENSEVPIDILTKKFELDKKIAEHIKLTNHWITYLPDNYDSVDFRKLTTYNPSHIAELLQILNRNNIVSEAPSLDNIYYKPNSGEN